MPKYKGGKIIPFGDMKMTKPAPSKFKRGQTIGLAPKGQAKINEAPGYSKLKGKLKKKGLQTNYSN